MTYSRHLLPIFALAGSRFAGDAADPPSLRDEVELSGAVTTGTDDPLLRARVHIYDAASGAQPVISHSILEGNAPNPVAGATTIRYALPQAANVTLTVYDVLGRRVRTLASGEKQTPGRKQIRFTADGLSAGVYVVRMQAGSFTETRRMVVVE